MNIFILNSGRCGSSTFIRACSHISNYSAAHESRARLLGAARLDYPANHIEADNRLCWLLGRLHQRYGDHAFYLHLQRQPEATIASFRRRSELEHGILRAYRQGILMSDETAHDPTQLAADYLHTVTENIRHFLRDKSHCMTLQLETAQNEFPHFWERIGAQGDLNAALQEWQICYNAS